MALNLKRRLEVLERTVVREDDDRCVDCGLGPGAPVELGLAFEEVEGPDVCPGCGRTLVLRLEFDEPLREEPLVTR